MIDYEKIILAGGGNLDQSQKTDKFFLSQIPVSGKILYIPIALKNHSLFPGCANWFKSFLEKHNRSDIDTITMSEVNTGVFLMTFEAIYIGGGNTWDLIKELRDSMTLTLLREKIEEGTLVYGGSAGAIILGKDISKNPDILTYEVEDTDGLNLLSDFSVIPHADKVTLNESTLYPKSICIPEDGGVFCTDRGIEVVTGEVEFY